MEVAILTFLIRTYNAVIWTVVIGRILRNDRSVSRPARRMIVVLMVMGYWTLSFGTLTQFGVDGQIARWVYTAYTAVAAILGSVLAFEREGP